MTDRDSILLQNILDDLRTDVRELRAEVKSLRETVARVQGGWKVASTIAAFVGAGAGSLATWFGGKS